MTKLLDQWRSRWSYARGATKATHKSREQSTNDLTAALAEVDGLLAGINYLEKLEPTPDETGSPPVLSSNGKNTPVAVSAAGSWFGSHLVGDLPQSGVLDSEERPNIEVRHLRNILNDKVLNSQGNPQAKPRDSQWATLRSLRKASEYHYNHFIKATTLSASTDIRKLRKSYLTAKSMLEAGILTFRNVLHGRIPTTLVDIFAFASLSYIISKTLHAKGHIDESEILSGILDWRAAIVDESEQSAFDELAKALWPEAKEIMHFIPIEKNKVNSHATGLRGAPLMSPETPCDLWASRIPEECVTIEENPLLFTLDREYLPNSQEDANAVPCTNDFRHLPNGLEDRAHQLFQETMSYDDFMFSNWLNLDNNPQDGSMDPLSHHGTEVDINPNALDPTQTEFVTDTDSIPSKSPSSLLDSFDESSSFKHTDEASNDSILSRLTNTAVFQMVFRFFIESSEMSDLLTILSGRGLTAGKNGKRSSHPCPPWVAFEFFDQAPKHFFGPLYRTASQIDEAFSGIVAMAETFVRLGSLHTVREVENYIIAVGRDLITSPVLFAKVVSKTLIQCLIASESMKWPLLYPSCDKEVDEYSGGYIDRREKSEKSRINSDAVIVNSVEDESSPTSSTSDPSQKPSPNSPKRVHRDATSSEPKRRRLEAPNHDSQQSPSASDASILQRCHIENCGKQYTGTGAHNNLSRHIQTDHNGRRFRCPNCMRTARRDNLRQHFLKVHVGFQMPDWLAKKKRGLYNPPPSN